LPAILRSLQRLLGILEEHKVEYMIIGGYVLPFYGRIRTTVDLDLAVAIKTEKELEEFCGWLQQNDFEAKISSFQNPVIVVLDKKERMEMELWLRPDGIVLGDQVLRRRSRVKMGDGVEAWVVGPEDFIVNKLARPERGAIDEQDVKSVLIRQKGKLDEEYLRKRAQRAGFLAVLQMIKAQ